MQSSEYRSSLTRSRVLAHHFEEHRFEGFARRAQLEQLDILLHQPPGDLRQVLFAVDSHAHVAILLLKVAAELSQAVQQRRVERCNLQQQNGHVRMTVNSEQDLPQIARWLVQQDAQLFQLGATRKSLETVFLEVMGEDARPG